MGWISGTCCQYLSAAGKYGRSHGEEWKSSVAFVAWGAYSI